MTGRKSQHSAGWYAGALVFWLLTAWLITVGLSSIIPQIFWPGSAAHGEGAAADCTESLRALRKELLARASERIAKPHAEPEDAQLVFFEHWDERHFAARASCQSDEKAWTELGRLRHGMQGLLDRFEREQSPRLLRLEQLLGADDAHAHLSGRTDR